ncbi:MAG: DUF2178 domain-containing protein [Methanobacteriaceae archaeon]|jgi:uncharacterized membrane protein|nr:DUF2178 domain-containing protein [Candidatus Methanorudis spinitermitis]
MKIKTVVIISTILSSITTLLWVLGLIFANINLFLLSMIVLAISIIPTIKYYKDIIEFFKTKNGEVIADERKDFIEEKSSLPSFAMVLVVSLYSGVAIFTLRNVYPQYTMLSYAFFSVFIIGLITFIISETYYKRKYGS